MTTISDRSRIATSVDAETLVKNDLLGRLAGMNPDQAGFAELSQQLTESRERIRKMEKILEQENQHALERMKAFEKNNESVFR